MGKLGRISFSGSPVCQDAMAGLGNGYTKNNMAIVRVVSNHIIRQAGNKDTLPGCPKPCSKWSIRAPR
eukprot:scaffold102186_cov53-Prasinocladus_malaysianus.AAC.2